MSLATEVAAEVMRLLEERERRRYILWIETGGNFT